MISEWFGPQFCGTKPAAASPAPKNARSCLYAASSCFLFFMGMSVLQSMSWNGIDQVQNSFPLPPSFFFLFLFLSWINCLIWFITWAHKLLNQHNWGWHASMRCQKWTPRGGGSRGRKGQTWAWLLKLVLLLDALHLGNMVLAWVQGLESEHLSYKLPSSLWHP